MIFTKIRYHTKYYT